MGSKFMVRERTPFWFMLYAVYVYFCSNSLRRASNILEPLRRRSYVSIWRWVQRLAPISNRFHADRRMVSFILIDETMIHIARLEVWLWVAFEPERRVFLGFHISYQRNTWDAYIFLKHLRSRYGRKPIYTDEASWYPEACRWLRLNHHIYGYGWWKLMERMNETIKDRLECFDDLFPCWKPDCDKEHVPNWLKLFQFIYNYVRVHTELGHPPVETIRGSEASRFRRLILREVSLR